MAEHWSMSASMLIQFPKRRTGNFIMARFDNFADLAEHYASLTSPDAFAGAFTSEIAASQLSIHDEPTADDLPDAAASRAVAAHVTGEIFNPLAVPRLEPVPTRKRVGQGQGVDMRVRSGVT